MSRQASSPAERSFQFTELSCRTEEARPRWVTWRSFLVGTLGVCLVCGLTPFNDYVVANTFLVGSYLPIVVVAAIFFLVVILNAPLHRLLPRHALSSGELAVIVAMMLVACSLPSQGLMRAFLPTLITPFHFGAINESFWKAFVSLNLPEWMFPVEDVARGRESPIVTFFYSRVQPGDPIPYWAWVTPIAGWSIFLGALMSGLVVMSILLRPQWADNERLPFPLVQLQLALIEPPAKGRMLNRTLGSYSFWLGLGAVFVLQCLVALHDYFPRGFPRMFLEYDLRSIMSEDPWVHFVPRVKQNTIYFTFVGVAYFIRSKVAFSLWSIFLIRQLVDVEFRKNNIEVLTPAWMDQHLGASVVLLIAIIRVGRHYLWNVIRGALKGGRNEREYLSHRTAVLLLLVSLAIMLGWLILVGMQWWMAALMLAVVLLAHLVTTRIVAETGLPYLRTYTSPAQIYTNIPPAMLTGRDVFFSGVLAMNGTYATRESLMTLSMHALQLDRETDPPAHHGRKLIATLIWALLLGFIVAAASSLWCYYSYATPLAPGADSVINPHLLEVLPRQEVVDPLVRHQEGRFVPKNYSPLMHFSIGVAIMSALEIASLRWANWPFMPVGYLMSMNWYMEVAWFSLFLGWLAKVLIVRFGGTHFYVIARPAFVGMIVGEALAAAFWLIVNLTLALNGYSYERINFLPS